MKAIRHQITRTKQEVMVLLLMLAVSVAALATGAANAQSPADPQTPAPHPCQGLSSITMIVSAPTLAAGNDLTKQTTAPSGDCTLTVTLYASERTSIDLQLKPGESCTATVVPSVRSGGVLTLIQRNDECAALAIRARVAVAGGSAHVSGPTGSSGVSGASAPSGNVSRARARTIAAGFYPNSGYIRSDVKGRWTHTADDVLSYSRPSYLNTFTAYYSKVVSQRPTTTARLNPTQVDATNEVTWEHSSDQVTAIVTLSMLPAGGYHCTYRWDGVPPHRWRHVTFSGECFP